MRRAFRHSQVTGNYSPEIGGYSELPSMALSRFQSMTAPVVELKRSSWVFQQVPLIPRLVILFTMYLSQCVTDGKFWSLYDPVRTVCLPIPALFSPINRGMPRSTKLFFILPI